MAVALSCCPSFAFTLSAPSLAQSAVKADVQQIYMIITTTHIASVTMYPTPTPTITPTITLTTTLTTTIITTTHIASVTMYPRPIPTITIRRSPSSSVLSS